MSKLLVWFDLPVSDMDRAIAFYAAVLASPVTRQDFGPMSLGFFDHGENDAGGCLFVGDVDAQATAGPLIYFTVEGRLDDAVAQVEANGGQVLEPKHQIGPHGYRAVVRDSEGNRVALHSMSE